MKARRLGRSEGPRRRVYGDDADGRLTVHRNHRLLSPRADGPHHLREASLGIGEADLSAHVDLTPMPAAKPTPVSKYEGLVADLSRLLEDARRVSARVVNTVMTATYWEFGRRIVEFEQRGEARAGYGEELLRQLARDLTKRLGRGFSVTNLQNFRTFFLNWPIQQTACGKLPREKIHQTVSGVFASLPI